MSGARADDDGKVELADDGWLAAAGRVAADLVAEHGYKIPGERLSICEVFMSPPAHLRMGGDKVYWTLVIGDHEASATREERRDADILIETDYQRALVGARSVYPEEIAEPAADAPPAFRLMLRRLHNRLAVITR
jgi:hypothetical protein